MSRWVRRWGPALTLLLFAFLLRAWRLGAQSLWYDEAYMWWVTTGVSLSKMISLSIREIIPPAYYLLIRAWIPLAGTGEVALRFPSALLGVLGVAAAGRLVGRLTDSRLGQEIALGLFAIGTPVLWAAREVRMYGPLLTWTLLADVALVETLLAQSARARRRWAWLWAVATLLACYTLVLAGFWLLGQALFALLFLSGEKKGRFLSWLRTLAPMAALVALLITPWALVAARHLGENAGYWAGYLPTSAFFKTAIQGMTLSDFWIVSQIQTISLVLLSGSVIATLLTLNRPRVALYPLCYALPLLPMALVFRWLPKWGARHAVLFSPVPLLAVALAWGTVHKRTRWIVLGLLTLATLVHVSILLRTDANLLVNPGFAHEDWRGVADYVQERRSADDVVIIETGSVFPAWAYYSGWNGLLPLPDDELLDVTHVLHYANTAPLLNEALQDASDVWVVNWLDDVTDPTDVVPTLLSYLGEEQPTPYFHGLELQHFELNQPIALPPEPPTMARPACELLPHLTLWGYTLPDAASPPDQPMILWTWWTTDDPAAHEATFPQILVQLQDSNDHEWGRVDTTPGGGDYRPERWPVATPVLGQVSLPVDPWAPPGTYTPTLTLYSEGERSELLSLKKVSLTQPTEPPSLPAEAEPISRRGKIAPVALLGVQINADEVTPCGTLTGRLFWEIEQPPTQTYRLTVAAGAHRQTLEPAPDFATQPWEVGDRFATPFRVPIDCRTLDQTEALHVSLTPAGQEAATVTWTGPKVSIASGRIFTAPDDITLLKADFEDDFAALVGYRFEPPEPRANAPFTVTLIWRAGETGETPYNVFVHVTGPDAVQPIAQHDSWPQIGEKPTHTWAPGEIVVDPHPLPSLPAGDYALRVGLYDPEGIRLQQTDEEAVSGLKDRVDIPLTILP